MQGIPRGAAIAIDDMLDKCAQIDGLCGGDNLVDDRVIPWVQAAIQNRGASGSVLWIDEPVKPPDAHYPLLTIIA